MRVRVTENDYHKLAQARGFTWVGVSLPRITKIATQWRCAKEHQWVAKYGDIKRGNGCPHCAGVISKTADDYHKLAKARGFTWVGESLPKNTTIPTRWKCAHEHEWAARYNNIQQDSGCPHCLAEHRRQKRFGKQVMPSTPSSRSQTNV